MISKKSILCIVFICILSVLTLTACKDDHLEYQSQFLNHFGIEFISTKHQKAEADELKDYIYIELNESEKSKTEEYISSSDLFYSISEKNSDYILLNEILENDFSEDIKNVENGYFSIYNKISQQIIDLSSDDFQNIDMDFFTAFIYDSENNIIYLFDYNIS